MNNNYQTKKEVLILVGQLISIPFVVMFMLWLIYVDIDIDIVTITVLALSLMMILIGSVIQIAKICNMVEKES